MICHKYVTCNPISYVRMLGLRFGSGGRTLLPTPFRTPDIPQQKIVRLLIRSRVRPWQSGAPAYWVDVLLSSAHTAKFKKRTVFGPQSSAKLNCPLNKFRQRSQRRLGLMLQAPSDLFISSPGEKSGQFMVRTHVRINAQILRIFGGMSGVLHLSRFGSDCV